jgi:hypothetical protein
MRQDMSNNLLDVSSQKTADKGKQAYLTLQYYTCTKNNVTFTCSEISFRKVAGYGKESRG